MVSAVPSRSWERDGNRRQVDQWLSPLPRETRIFTLS
jgi:hypothetical protein